MPLMIAGRAPTARPRKVLSTAVALRTADAKSRLGAEPAVDSPYDVPFEIGDQRLALDPNGHPRGVPGSAGYREVEEISARFQELLAAGAAEHESPKDAGNGAPIASVKDADGNVIGLIQPASPRLHPWAWLGTADPCSLPEGLRLNVGRCPPIIT